MPTPSEISGECLIRNRHAFDALARENPLGLIIEIERECHMVANALRMMSLKSSFTFSEADEMTSMVYRLCSKMEHAAGRNSLLCDLHTLSLSIAPLAYMAAGHLKEKNPYPPSSLANLAAAISAMSAFVFAQTRLTIEGGDDA